MKSRNVLKYGLIGLALTLLSGLANAAAMTNYLENKLIDAFLRACNGEICGAWSAWVTATAQHPPTVPAQMTGITITVVRSGP